MVSSSYPRFAGDGAGSFIGALARALVRRGHAVHVVAPHDPAVEPMDQAGVQVHRFRYAPLERMHIVGHGVALQADRALKAGVPLLMPGFIACALRRVVALHRRHPFDLIHGHWAVPGGVIADLASRLLRRPLLVSLHGSDVYVVERNGLYAAVARPALRRAGCITACSRDLGARIVAVGADETRVRVVPYGVDIDRYATGHPARYRQQLGISQDARVIGALGRLVYKKGFHTLIDAMPRVLAQCPDAYCLIGGAGDLDDDLRRRIRARGLDGRVIMPGHVGWDETPDYNAACDVVTVPSVIDVDGNVDGLPNVLLEAMASGRAVVASRVAGLPDVVEHEANGLLAPPGDAVALAAALVRILDDTPLRDRLGVAARQTMVAHHSWEATAARFEALYVAATSGGA